jgi:hypothetical protein
VPIGWDGLMVQSPGSVLQITLFFLPRFMGGGPPNGLSSVEACGMSGPVDFVPGPPRSAAQPVARMHPEAMIAIAAIIWRDALMDVPLLP